MKETAFIEQNKEKWKRFQELTASNESDPEEISNLYSDITADLSYAQTFYNRRTVRVYLNQIAQGIHNLVHKERSESLKKFISVWKVSLPIEIYRSRKHLLFACCMFVFWAIVGAITTDYNPDFPRTIMGNGYVEQTLENIKNGDPLAIYHSNNQLTMFFEITLNNIKVAFYTFIFGVVFTIGTHIFLFNNGVMLGAFQYFFHLKGVLLTSFLGIWIHGAFEISAIVIAGGAGITLGNGWLFPGSYTRLQSMQLSAKRGLKIMMSLVPFLIAAGFLESFVTHNYLSLSEWSKWTLILLSFSIIVFYYVIYPLYVARKYPELVHEKHVANRTYNNTFDLTKLRTFGQLFADTFSFYRVYIVKIMKINLALTVPIVILLVVLQDVHRYEDLTHQYWYDWSAQLTLMMGVDGHSAQDYWVLLGWTIVFTLVILSVFYLFKEIQNNLVSKIIDWKSLLSYCFKNAFGVWCCNLLIYVILFLVPWYWMFLVLFAVPFFYILAPSFTFGDTAQLGIGKRLKQGFYFGVKSYGNSLLSIGLLCVITFLFVQPIAFVGSIHDGNLFNDPIISDLLDLLANFVKNVARNYTDDFMVPANIVRQIIYFFAMALIVPFFIIMLAFIYFDVAEKNQGLGLRKSFEAFGKRKRNQETSIDFE